MNTALYGTIWVALLLFCVGETGRRRVRTGRSAPWAWWAFVAGALVCVVHVAIAMGAAHEWSHQSAIAATARQTMAVYGLDWGGGVYVNYAFVGVWLLDAWRWRRRPARDVDVITWTTRIFFLIVIVNAAVIFASPTRRLAGALTTIWLLWLWRPESRRRPTLTLPAPD